MTELGDVIDGRFRLERTLGTGGMGIVYLATDLSIDRQVAVKILRSTVIQSEEARIRLQREMEVLARLKSPHVAEYHSSGYLPDHSPYLVIEYLNGRDLRAELRRRGMIPIPEACAYLLQTCRGIAVAHAQNIVHRDLKPHNLIVTCLEGPRLVKIVDFGIAKILGEADLGLTASDTAVGTPLYMCPEQLLGARRITTRSDVWSLGVILYELISGTSPFSDDSPGAVIAAITLDEPVPIRQLLPETPKDLAELIHSALQKRPERRLPTVEAMAETLRRFALPDDALTVQTDSQEGASQKPRPPPPRLQRKRYLRDEIRSSVDRILVDDSVATQELARASAVPSAVDPERLGRVPTMAAVAEAALTTDNPTPSGAFSATRAPQRKLSLLVGPARQRKWLILPWFVLPVAVWLTWSLWGWQPNTPVAASAKLPASASSTEATTPSNLARAVPSLPSSPAPLVAPDAPSSASAERAASRSSARATALGAPGVPQGRVPVKSNASAKGSAPSPSQQPKDKSVPLYL
jgi:serine/threonine-protein kinase